MTPALQESGATRTSSVLAILLSSSAVLIALNSYPLGILLGLLSVMVIAIGVLQMTRSWLAVGTLLLVAVIALTAVRDGPTLPVFASLALAFVGWDCGEYAIGLGEQIGRAGDTTRQELFHTGSSLTIATAGVTIGWTVITITPSNIPFVTIFLLAFGCLFLLAALWS